MSRFGNQSMLKAAAALANAATIGSTYAEFAIWAVILGGALWLAN